MDFSQLWECINACNGQSSYDNCEVDYYEEYIKKILDS